MIDVSLLCLGTQWTRQELEDGKEYPIRWRLILVLDLQPFKNVLDVQILGLFRPL